MKKFIGSLFEIVATSKEVDGRDRGLVLLSTT